MKEEKEQFFKLMPILALLCGCIIGATLVSIGLVFSETVEADFLDLGGSGYIIPFLIFTLIIAVFAALSSQKVFYVYAGIIGFCPLADILLKKMDGSAFYTSGLLILCIGFVRVYRFLKRYPIQEETQGTRA
jgi:hypothetical protein